jgi:hypothetical protein
MDERGFRFTECAEGAGKPTNKERRGLVEAAQQLEHTYRILYEQASSCQNGREGLAENHASTTQKTAFASRGDGLV